MLLQESARDWGEMQRRHPAVVGQEGCADNHFELLDRALEAGRLDGEDRGGFG
jgi:hypothetical protein